MPVVASSFRNDFQKEIHPGLGIEREAREFPREGDGDVLLRGEVGEVEGVCAEGLRSCRDQMLSAPRMRHGALQQCLLPSTEFAYLTGVPHVTWLPCSV